MLYMLWDLKLKVGHSTRTIRDCVTLGREDFTIQTALLEHRFIACRIPRWQQNLDENAQDRSVCRHRPQLYRGQSWKSATRGTASQGLRYVVEPNVKEAKGGLRDLQSLFWIAKPHL